MTGRRLPDGPEAQTFTPGDYQKITDHPHPEVAGTWYVCTPDGRVGWLKNHTVVEHEDGTITASPSILVSAGGREGSWHGYLEHGVWREV